MVDFSVCLQYECSCVGFESTLNTNGKVMLGSHSAAFLQYTGHGEGFDHILICFLDFLALLLCANVTEIWDKERGMGLRHDPSQIWPDQSVK